MIDNQRRRENLARRLRGEPVSEGTDPFAPILGRPEPRYMDVEVMTACPRHGLVPEGFSYCKVCHFGRGEGEQLEGVEVVPLSRLTEVERERDQLRAEALPVVRKAIEFLEQDASTREFFQDLAEAERAARTRADNLERELEEAKQAGERTVRWWNHEYQRANNLERLGEELAEAILAYFRPVELGKSSPAPPRLNTALTAWRNRYEAEDETEEISPENVKAAREMARGGGTMRRRSRHEQEGAE